jgi:hydrogenase nickel incorporation protein HypA/HybF
MHEASLMCEVFEIAFQTMRRQGATRLHRITLRVGVLAGVVPEALQFAFAAMKADTPASGAELEIHWLPVRLYCPACDVEFASEDYPDLCPRCGSAHTAVRQGQELDVVSLEMSRDGGAIPALGGGSGEAAPGPQREVR